MSGMTLNVDNDLVKPVIEAEIQAAVVRELGQMQDLFPQMVKAVITTKVDRDGKPSSYSGNKTYLEWAFQKSMHIAIQRAITEWIDGNQDELQKELSKQIMASKSEFAQSVLSALVGAVANQWRFNVEVTLPKDQAVNKSVQPTAGKRGG